MGEIFLSYSRHDQEFVDTIARNLEGQGLQVWVDQQDIAAGEEWRAAITNAISVCDAFLVILSPNCVASKNVVKELSIAESKDRHIIPIMFQTCEISPEMEYQLAGLQWIDFSELGFQPAMDRLVRVLRAGAGASPAPSPEPRRAAPPPQPQPSPPLQAAAGARLQAQAPQPAFVPQSLAAMLVGRWNVQIGVAYVGPMGQLVLDLHPNGAFNGQLMTPAGLSAIAGQWQVMPTGQLMLQGQQTVGWVSNPYVTMVQFAQVTPAALTGMTAAGEQVVWSKIG